MRTPTTIARGVTWGLVAVLATAAACGAGGGNPQADGDVVEEQNTGTSTTGTSEEAGTPGEAKFPVTAEYASMTWSITDLEPATDDNGDIVLQADVELENPHEFNYRPPRSQSPW